MKRYAYPPSRALYILAALLILGLIAAAVAHADTRDELFLDPVSVQSILGAPE
jgi:hypothetical protein